MAKAFSIGDCVRLPDGRIGRVREKADRQYRVRVRRKTSDTHQFLWFAAKDLKQAKCPKGWMTPEGYSRYLVKTLAKARKRRAGSRKKS